MESVVILDALEKKGYIIRHKYQSRAIELTKIAKEVYQEEAIQRGDALGRGRSVELNETVLGTSRVVEIPVLGRVAAGEPLFADQNIESHVALDADYAPRGETFALRVKGNSMMGAGIFDGDVVFCRVQEKAERGETVVALINDEATVKYFHPAKDRIILKPDNPDFKDIEVEKGAADFRILGKVVGLYRRI